MPITESNLPGVGKKFEIDIEDDQRLVVVIHNTGRRDVFLKPSDADGSDAKRLFELSDQLARQVGTILEGTYFQPVQSDTTETTLGGGTLIEWYEIPEDSPLSGESFGDILEDDRIDAALVAIQRGEEVVPASRPDRRLRPGDTLVVVGSNEQLLAFESLLGDDRGA